jgi:DNA-binding CsgD family transcriptional regulator
MAVPEVGNHMAYSPASEISIEDQPRWSDGTETDPAGVLADRAERLLDSYPDSAADLALRALKITDTNTQRRFARSEMAVKALVQARRLDEAVRVSRHALTFDDTPPRRAAHLRSTLCSILSVTGHPGEAVTEAETVLEEPGLPDDLYTSAQVTRIVGLIAQDDLSSTRRSAEAILGGAALADSDAALAGALGALAFIAWDEGRVVDALGLMKAATCRGDNGREEVRPFHPRFSLAAMLAALGHFEEAEIFIGEGRRELDQCGDTLWAAAPPVFIARIHQCAGRLADARKEAELGLATADALGTRLFSPMALSILASLALLAGDIQEAAALIGRAQSEPYAVGTDFGSTAHLWVRARIAEAQGGPTLAAKVLTPVYDDLAAHRRLLVEDPAAAAWLVHVALVTDKHRLAETVVQAVERLASGNDGIDSLAAGAAHARGVLEGDAGLIGQAVERYRHPLAAAAAQEDLGLVLGEKDGAALQQALKRYQALPASRDAARVRALLRNSRGRPSRAKRPVAGWASLTNTERKVSELVAQALTNAQIAERMYLSRHTVDFHLRQIFRRLQIRSRVELARLALEQREGVTTSL